jgi:hypothetical protein
MEVLTKKNRRLFAAVVLAVITASPHWKTDATSLLNRQGRIASIGAQDRQDSGQKSIHAKPGPRALQIPASQQEGLQRALSKAEHEIRSVDNETVKYFANNPGQKIVSRFLKNGDVRFESGRGNSDWELTFTNIGYCACDA